MSKHFSIGFIGAGNMASALAGGMIANGFAPQQLLLSDVNEQQLKNIAAEFGVKTTNNNEQVIKNSDVVVLALKPQVMQKVLEPLVDTLQKKQPLLISIAAGVTINSLDSWTRHGTGNGLAIIRCMPNTPALVKLAASGVFANEKTTAIQKQQAQQILEAVGIVEWLDAETKIDMVTALSGSGPAYFFLMIEAMIEAAIAQGLSRKSATELTLQTALGAATMAVQSDVEVSELRRRVTSPKGTTEAAISSFVKNNYFDVVKQALDAAYQRSIQLAKE